MVHTYKLTCTIVISSYTKWILNFYGGSLVKTVLPQQVAQVRFQGREYFFGSVQLLSLVGLFATPWTAAHQVSLYITSSQRLPKHMSIESVISSNPLILYHLLLLLPSIFSSSRVFPTSQLFTSGRQDIGTLASTSSLPMNTQDWSPLEWTGWISFQYKGLSRAFFNTTVQKHQFFSTQLSF